MNAASPELSPELNPESGRPGVAREMLLAQGKQLAESVIFQYERLCRCPFNQQEANRLRMLQQAFVAWERQANAQSDLDTVTLFADSRLRPFERKVNVNDLARLRRTPTQLQAHVQSVALARKAQRPARKEADDSIWPSAGPGI